MSEIDFEKLKLEIVELEKEYDDLMGENYKDNSTIKSTIHNINLNYSYMGEFDKALEWIQ